MNLCQNFLRERRYIKFKNRIKTALALYLISKIQKKTLVVVHKEFLMNQWRIELISFT